MPEYLAPGVYVEEVDTGSKPIEGVSTSTTGLVGVAERGPVNVPVLVTSTGEYTRWFGGVLHPDLYEKHRFLPHAVEGFFTNGGKRAYVVRALEAGAQRASTWLFQASDPSVSPPAAGLTGVVAAPVGAGAESVVLLPGSGLEKDAWVRLGDGSKAEYRQLAGDPAPDTQAMVPLALPLARSHTTGAPVAEHTHDVEPEPYTLPDGAEVGDTAIVVAGALADIAELVDLDLSTDTFVEIGAQAVAEYRRIVSVSGPTAVDATTSRVRLQLDAGLTLAQATGIPVRRFKLGAPVHSTTVGVAAAGSGLLVVDDRAGNLDDSTHLALVGAPGEAELRRIGELSELPVTTTLDDHDAGELVQVVTFPGTRTLDGAVTSSTTLTLQAGQTAGLLTGQRITIAPGGAGAQTLTIDTVDAANHEVEVTTAVTAGDGDEVVVAMVTDGDASAGDDTITLDDRSALAEGDVIRIGAGPTEQLVTVSEIAEPGTDAPDPGTVGISPALAADVPGGTAVVVLGAPSADSAQAATVVALRATAGSTAIHVTDGGAFTAGQTIQVGGGAHAAYYRLTGTSAGVAVDLVSLVGGLARSHPAGSRLWQRFPLLQVEALDAGVWGNRLRVSVEDEPSGLVAGTTVKEVVDLRTIRLASAAGLQAGTVLEFVDRATGASVGAPVKVSGIDRNAQNAIALADPGISTEQAAPGLVVRSRELRLTVRLLRQPDPAVPSRDSQAIDVETFRHLSLDPRHSNYVEKIVGKVGGPLRKWDRRPEGSSLYVRVLDTGGSDAEKQSVRLGPERLVDQLPDGRWVPAQLPLDQTLGDDAIGTIGDSTYLGADAVDPEDRTGLQSLRNVEDVSLVAIPGQVSPFLQQGLIDHCELMRYRFAVLDTTPEPTDTISDAQTQRQAFDTKYAALYYPWLSVPEPYPANLADVHDYPIPPSGHVLGVYARTDVTRGVHKAPANEVVQGITGLRRKLNRAEHDILNPYPTNVNVIRDFRDDSRGIRVYGGRVLTSDPDWKYVNVRRLLIFIEASLDRGLQWVVFEPNADPLWARVRRVASNFLTTVWRSGALEGTKPEEAYFVKCDRTTMTQTDIDNGRLIVQIGVAPVKPAEFVILRIGLWTAHADT